MKNKKGFTLVELLAVIAILGILATISVVAVERTLNNSKNKATEIQEELINDAARAYAADNLSTCKNGCSVSIQDLINGGYIDDKDGIGDPNTIIYINKNGNNYTVSSSNDIHNFAYTGSVQKFTIPKTGTYKLEVWGAQGGYNTNTTYLGANGGYSKGNIKLNKGTVLYIYVGGQGNFYPTSGQLVTGGFNGGGNAYTSAWGRGSGGGATDIRIGTDSLYARVIVAGGGGGSTGKTDGMTTANAGGVGGGTSGLAGTLTTGTSPAIAGNGATQTSVGTSTTTSLNGSFGKGGSATSGVNAAGGGGGWYGGSGGNAAGGGSGYIYTSSTASYCTSGCLLNSSYYLTNASTSAGNTTFASPDGENETGHSGNGYARITKQ